LTQLNLFVYEDPSSVSSKSPEHGEAIVGILEGRETWNAFDMIVN
jgi:hypothetical protein